ncbi:MAG: hypothetical protein ABI231_06265, partial [Candidatus Tumulicola sp.]
MIGGFGSAGAIAALVAGTVLFALAARTPVAAQQDPAVAALDRLTGTWEGLGTFVDSAYGKAGSARATT